MCFYKLSVAPQLGQGAEKFLDEISFKSRNFLILILKNIFIILANFIRHCSLFCLL